MLAQKRHFRKRDGTAEKGSCMPLSPSPHFRIYFSPATQNKTGLWPTGPVAPHAPLSLHPIHPPNFEVACWWRPSKSQLRPWDSRYFPSLPHLN